MTRYLYRAITDGVDPDGTIVGHYGDPVPMSQVADDYGVLTCVEFDKKYPDWYDDRTFIRELKDEFNRRDLLSRAGVLSPEVGERSGEGET